MLDSNSAHAALISNVSQRDRAKDVEQFDDILRTFINERHKFENRFGKSRDEDKVLAVKKLMLERLLNFILSGMTISRDGLHHIIVDKVSTVPKEHRHECSSGNRNGGER